MHGELRFFLQRYICFGSEPGIYLLFSVPHFQKFHVVFSLSVLVISTIKLFIEDLRIPMLFTYAKVHPEFFFTLYNS